VKRLTAARLRAAGARRSQLRIFRKAWPDGAPVTAAAMRKARKLGLDVRRFVRLFPPLMRAEYVAEAVPLLAECRAKVDAVWGRCNAKADVLRAEYGARCDVSRAVRRPKTDILLYAFDAKVDAVWVESGAKADVIWAEYGVKADAILVGYLRRMK